MTDDAEDRSTWPRNGQVIRRDELLRLIEENSGPEGLDLRGGVFVGDEQGEHTLFNSVNLGREALAPLAEAHRQANKGREPRWLFDHAINLLEAQLEAADLRGARLTGARLWFAELQGVQFEGADLREAQLDHAQLQGAGLGGAKLQGSSLMEADLQGARLFYAQLQGAHLAGAQLEGVRLRGAELQRLDMYDVARLDGAHWYGAFLDHTRIKRESLGKAIGDELKAHKERTEQACRQASEAYLLLKNNFNQIGRYEDASWAYVKEQQMEKMAHYWEWRSRGWQVWRGWRSLWRWFGNRAFEFLTGHGEEPLKAARAGVFIILGFAVGFTQAIGNFWDALVYSIATFATFNLARLEPQGRGTEIASSIEAILGISVLALVVFTLGNRMSRG
jgi:uncharacterized protein YjbI with pentapeptide repeats